MRVGKEDGNDKENEQQGSYEAEWRSRHEIAQKWRITSLA